MFKKESSQKDEVIGAKIATLIAVKGTCSRIVGEPHSHGDKTCNGGGSRLERGRDSNKADVAKYDAPLFEVSETKDTALLEREQVVFNKLYLKEEIQVQVHFHFEVDIPRVIDASDDENLKPWGFTLEQYFADDWRALPPGSGRTHGQKLTQEVMAHNQALRSSGKEDECIQGILLRSEKMPDELKLIIFAKEISLGRELIIKSKQSLPFSDFGEEVGALAEKVESKKRRNH